MPKFRKKPVSLTAIAVWLRAEAVKLKALDAALKELEEVKNA